MTTKENLLVTAMEECSEIQQAISKSLRFGLDNYHPADPQNSNVQQILTEYYQLEAVMEMLMDYGILPRVPKWERTRIKTNKAEKVNKYLELSRDLGLVSDS